MSSREVALTLTQFGHEPTGDLSMVKAVQDEVKKLFNHKDVTGAIFDRDAQEQFEEKKQKYLMFDEEQESSKVINFLLYFLRIYDTISWIPLGLSPAVGNRNFFYRSQYYGTDRCEFREVVSTLRVRGARLNSPEFTRLMSRSIVTDHYLFQSLRLFTSGKDTKVREDFQES